MAQAKKATARTEEEKVIAHERAKAKEAKAEMELHEAKARHAAEKLNSKHHGHGHQPLGTVPMPGATNPSYPLAGSNVVPLRNNMNNYRI